MVLAGLAGCSGAAPTATPAPTPTPTVTLIPSPTPTPGTLPDVLGFRSTNKWLSPEGAYHLMGEVVNQGDYPLSDVVVTARLADGLGQTVAEAYDSIDMPVLLPGRSAPFDVVLYGERVAAAYNYQLWAEGDGVSAEASGVTDQVAVSGSPQTEPDGALRFDGTLTNNSAHVLSRVVVAITFFSRDARVVGGGAATTGGPILPGETATFTRLFLPSDFSDETAGYTMLAEGLIAAPTATPTATAAPTPEPTAP
jgi:hypothetical protein